MNTHPVTVQACWPGRCRQPADLAAKGYGLAFGPEGAYPDQLDTRLEEPRARPA